MPGGTTLTQLDRRIDKQKDRPVDRQKSRCTNIYLSMNSLFSVGRVDARVSPLHRRLCAPPPVLGKLGEKTQQRQTPYELSLSLSLSAVPSLRVSQCKGMTTQARIYKETNKHTHKQTDIIHNYIHTTHVDTHTHALTHMHTYMPTYAQAYM